jgi:hypothetical protein
MVYLFILSYPNLPYPISMYKIHNVHKYIRTYIIYIYIYPHVLTLNEEFFGTFPQDHAVKACAAAVAMQQAGQRLGRCLSPSHLMGTYSTPPIRR